MISTTHLGQLRVRQLMTAQDMTDRLNQRGVKTSRVRLVKIEHNRAKPTPEEKKAIARILRVKVKEAFPQ
ncbi:MAG TPA: hypothetical protein PKE33_04400 [Kiritimatiellia bacterium]|nr:hypothetical protein [Kiritimatiellia bacterium]